MISYVFFSKIQQYSPSEPAKVYEKNTNRRTNTLFNPKATLSKIKQGEPSEYLDDEGRKDLIRQYVDVRIKLMLPLLCSTTFEGFVLSYVSFYLQFKQLMLQLDPDDVDDEENAKVLNALSSGSTNPMAAAAGGNTAILTEADQVALTNYKVFINLRRKIMCLLLDVFFYNILCFFRTFHHRKCPS